MDPGMAKKTQDTLGKIIKKPPLTDKLLGKPPFRFLHDVMTSVIKTTGFMKGLYTDAEMNSENVKEKEAKIAFLQKAIDMVAAVTGRSMAAKPVKIVAGHEPERTNEFLQALAAAINANVDSDEYVNKVLSGGGGGESKKEAKEERPEKDKSRTRSASRRKDDDKHKKEDKEKSHDRDKDREKRHRDRDRDGEGKEEKDKERHRERRDKSRDKEDRHREKDRERRKKTEDCNPKESLRKIADASSSAQESTSSVPDPPDTKSRHSRRSAKSGGRLVSETHSPTKSRHSADAAGKKARTKKIVTAIQPSSSSLSPVLPSQPSKAKSAKPEKSQEKRKAAEGAAKVTRNSDKQAPQGSSSTVSKSGKSPEKVPGSPKKQPHSTSQSSSFPSTVDRKESQPRKRRDVRTSQLPTPVTKHSSSPTLHTASSKSSPGKAGKVQNSATAASASKQGGKGLSEPSHTTGSKKAIIQRTGASAIQKTQIVSLSALQSASADQDKTGTGCKSPVVEISHESKMPLGAFESKLVAGMCSIPEEKKRVTGIADMGATMVLQNLSSERLDDDFPCAGSICRDNLSSSSLSPPSSRSDASDSGLAFTNVVPFSLKAEKVTSKLTKPGWTNPTGYIPSQRSEGGGSDDKGPGDEASKGAVEGEEAPDPKQKNAKVKESMSHFNLREGWKEEASGQAGSAAVKKEVEEKENESPEQNGERESSQDAPSRLQRPTSAKGARRRRQGREAREDDDEEFQQRENHEPSIGENDLPPQVTAARRMARPPSARPAPPRPKQEGVEAEPAMRLGTAAPANLIVDDGKQSDDEDENFLVEESAPPPPPIEPVSSQAEPEDDAEHGALVKKMLESKKEAEQQQQPTKKTEIERPTLSDAQRRKQRELVAKEIERLQTSIQSLTRSANPLGKIMDYVQEDMDSMQKELDRWRNENKEHALALRRERSVTDRAIEPLKAQLADIDRAITDQLDLIAASKSNIIRNDRRIEKMLQSIARS